MSQKLLLGLVLWALIGARAAFAGDAEDDNAAKPGETTTARAVTADDVPHGEPMRLDLGFPRKFVEAYFSDPTKLLTGTPESSTGAIDGTVKIVVTKDKDEFTVDAELVTFRQSLGLSTIGFNQCPTTLDNAEDTAVRICEMTGGDRKVIEKWAHAVRANEGTTEKFALVKSRSLGGTHAVEIRNSYDSERPWRTLYHFTRPRKTSGQR